MGFSCFCAKFSTEMTCRTVFWTCPACPYNWNETRYLAPTLVLKDTNSSLRWKMQGSVWPSRVTKLCDVVWAIFQPKDGFKEGLGEELVCYYM